MHSRKLIEKIVISHYRCRVDGRFCLPMLFLALAEDTRGQQRHRHIRRTKEQRNVV